MVASMQRCPGARTLTPKECAREVGSLPGASCLLVGHAHGLADLGQGGLRYLVGLAVALVQHVLHVVDVVLVLMPAFADGREVLVHRVA